MKIKVLTFNIHKGFNWNNTKLTIESLKHNISELTPDIVFLQEVVGKNKVFEKKFDHWIDNQFDFLAEDIWHDGIFSEHAVYDHRNHGNVILSKYPIIYHEIINISLNPLEQRSLLFAELRVKDKNVHCYCTHLNLLHRDRIKQYALIKDYINTKSKDVDQIILAGDFNDWNQHASKNLMSIEHIHDAYKLKHGEYPRTFPAMLPFFKLDRIYTRGFNIHHAEVLKSEQWSSLSDHLPIHLEVEFK